MEKIVWKLLSHYQQQELYNLYLSSTHSLRSQTGESLATMGMITWEKYSWKLTPEGTQLMNWAIANGKIERRMFYLVLLDGTKSGAASVTAIVKTASLKYVQDAKLKSYITISKNTFDYYSRLLESKDA